MKLLALHLALMSATCFATGARIFRDPGPIETLDLAAGPGGTSSAPVGPFRFVKELHTGITKKVIVTDARGSKWVVKFGEEAKPEIFASRIAWAAGYPTNASYFVPNGRIDATQFSGAKFERFYGPGFREIPGGKLDLNESRADQRELNGLKLTLMLVGNWDVKSSNTGVFEIGGHQYAVVTDWGASMGDPAAIDPAGRKWDCRSYAERTKTLVDGAEGGYALFNYRQYASRHEHAISANIPVEHVKWWLARMNRLSDAQVRAAMMASGATPSEVTCFTRAFRDRLNRFAAATVERPPQVTHTRTIKKTTKTRIVK